MQTEEQNRRRTIGLRKATVWSAVVFLACVCLGYYEIHSSTLQAYCFSKLGREIGYELGDGPSHVLRAPMGPYDKRLGYTNLPVFSQRLEQNNFVVAEQAKVSARMTKLIRKGFFPIYREKTQAGLKILSSQGKTVFSRNYPHRIFTSFSEIPPIIVDMLLFIENRKLLDTSRPFINPAVDWGRLCKAVLENGLHVIDPSHPVSGGSTLATQLEKFRHSYNGVTPSIKEKMRQMASASLRAYLDGENTLRTRQRIVLDYINSIPLAALPQYGEIHGLGDGLWVWYGAEFDHTINILSNPRAESDPILLREKALALQRVLSLLLAQNRPTDFLLQSREALTEKCNGYIRLLAREGIISEQLKFQALQIPLVFRTGTIPPYQMSLVEKKSANSIRTKLLSLVGIDRLYDLDRMDLSVKSTLDLPIQVVVTREIIKLHDPNWIVEKGLNGPRLLSKGDPSKVICSFTLYEKTPRGNLLRVQTDNYDQPLNINEGTKLNLGSTAKLRTLIHYLEIIASLHERFSRLSREDLLKIKLKPEENLSQWAIYYLLETHNKSLIGMLNDAMARSYSANPNGKFFTGGGLHAFENYNAQDNHRIMSLREAFRRSVNLVFVRLMQDIVNYHIFSNSRLSGEILTNPDHSEREDYLAKFADFEGSVFLQRFYEEYKDKSPEEAFKLLLKSVGSLPHRLAIVYRYLSPKKGRADLWKFLKDRLPNSKLTDRTVRRLYGKYSPERWSLDDLGHILRIHPLELWLAAYLIKHPEARLEEVLMESSLARQEAYQWLFRTSRKEQQDQRIRIILEKEAFENIHKAWKRLGYPFDDLVPSYATAIGSSADRPSALAELMGILINDGKRMLTYRIEEINLAENTPYEIRYVRDPLPGERVMKTEIAQVVKEALFDVARNGTARRARRAFYGPDGTEVPVGGKTGTGDHVYKIFGPGAQLIASKVMNRSATFAFIIGEKFFGNITLYVPGPEAAQYAFTSALPVAIFKNLSQTLMNRVFSYEGKTEKVSKHIKYLTSDKALSPLRENDIAPSEEKKKQFPRVETIKVSIANLRARPTTKSPIAGKLRAGAKVTLLMRQDEWYIVKLPSGRLAWAHQSLFSDPKVTTKSTEPIFPPDSPQPSPQREITVTLKTPIGRVREGPSLDSTIKLRLKRGATVSIIEVKGDWYHIALRDGRTGWAHQSLFFESQ